MNKEEFLKQLAQTASQYDQDNSWFGFRTGGQPWSMGTWDEFVSAAWKLYKNASSNHLQMILLGDTKIRSDPGLLFDFGLVANTNTPQEDEDRTLVSNLMRQRSSIASKSIYEEPVEMMGRGSIFAGSVEMMGPGSILSAKRWSPALNDALMLGGIIKRHDFHFALNLDERKIWDSLCREHLEPPGELRQLRKRKRTNLSYAILRGHPLSPSQQREAETMWLKFLRRVPRVLWEHDTPRVFVRELLGLKFFGYRPLFSRYELMFIPSGEAGKVPTPTFQGYLNCLRKVGFERSNKELIMSSLSEFLFNDVNALTPETAQLRSKHRKLVNWSINT